MMENYFPLNASKYGQKLGTIVKRCRIIIFSYDVANIAKGDGWLARFGARKLNLLTIYVLNKYNFLRIPDFFTEPLYT